MKRGTGGLIERGGLLKNVCFKGGLLDIEGFKERAGLIE